MKRKLLAAKLLTGFICFILAVICADTYIMEFIVRSNQKMIDKRAGSVEATVSLETIVEYDILPEKEETHISPYQYQQVDKEKLMRWLTDKNSLLAEEFYMEAILSSAEKYDVHPFILFSITGQEQGFVPKSHSSATQMANNPFNVFGSWKRYNTNIQDAADIAARTINRLTNSCPENMDYFKWLNHRGGRGGGYATDTNWHVGVSYYFDLFCEEVGEL